MYQEESWEKGKKIKKPKVRKWFENQMNTRFTDDTYFNPLQTIDFTNFQSAGTTIALSSSLQAFNENSPIHNNSYQQPPQVKTNFSTQIQQQQVCFSWVRPLYKKHTRYFPKFIHTRSWTVIISFSFLLSTRTNFLLISLYIYLQAHVFI